jgi:hypothetical protein
MSAEAILEVIVISQDSAGQPHIAPFGIRRRNGLVHIAPYRPSLTLDNLMQQQSATLNMTDDVRVFAAALTGRTCWQLTQQDGAWLLDSALAYQQLALHHIEDDPVRPSLYFSVQHQAQLAMFQGFNRAQSAVIELAVLVSRLGLIATAQIQQQMMQLQVLIDKTAGEHEWQAWQWLQERVQDYEAQHDASTSQR